MMIKSRYRGSRCAKKTSRKHLNPNSMILLGVTSRSGVSGVEETGPPGSVQQ